MMIRGCVPYKNKKEKLKAFKDLKREFGDDVRIFIKDHLLLYTCKVDRSYYL